MLMPMTHRTDTCRPKEEPKRATRETVVTMTEDAKSEGPRTTGSPSKKTSKKKKNNMVSGEADSSHQVSCLNAPRRSTLCCAHVTRDGACVDVALIGGESYQKGTDGSIPKGK